MVLEVLADPGKILGDVDAVFSQERRGSDARQLQQVGRVEGSTRRDHFAGHERLGGRSAHPRLDADGALPLEKHPGRVRAAQDLEVRPMLDRVEIRPRGAPAHAAGEVSIERGETLLSEAVDVFRQRVARLLYRLEKEPE